MWRSEYKVRVYKPVFSLAYIHIAITDVLAEAPVICSINESAATSIKVPPPPPHASNTATRKAEPRNLIRVIIQATFIKADRHQKQAQVHHLIAIG